MSILTDPPFAANPPVKVNINAKILGLVIGILAAIGALLSLIGLIALFSLTSSNPCAPFGYNCSVGVALPVGGLIGYIISLVGNILAALGGFRMYQGNRQGKDLVIYGLVLELIGSLITTVGYGGYGIGSFVVSLIIDFIIYYLVVVSRFPGESSLAPPATTSWGGGGPSAPPPPPV